MEFYNSKTKKWNIIDPFNELIIDSRLTVGRYMQTSRTLMLFAVGKYQYCPVRYQDQEMLHSPKQMTYALDVTLKYSTYHHQTLAAKNSFFIEEGINRDVQIVAPFLPNLCLDLHLKKALEDEQAEIEKLEMNFFPEKLDEFRSHRHFTLPSLLKRFQDFKPGAKPFKDCKFKKEEIYLKKDIIHLHTTEQWKRLGRKVKNGEQPFKKVKGYYNDKTKLAKIYASWQTEHFENKLNPDGTLPENEYGNIEYIKERDLPEGTAYVDVFRARFLCKELGFEFKDAITGFTVAPNGMKYPVKKGVVVHKENVDKIMEVHAVKEKEKEKRLAKKYKTEAKKLWRYLIKKVKFILVYLCRSL
jgi:hypothetical protein